MPEFLFATWDGGGNVPPALGIAAELRTRGHGVHVIGHEGNRTAVTAAGFEFTAYRRAKRFSSAEVNPPERMVEIFNDEGIASDVVDLARSRVADVVIIDALLLAALPAARDAGLTYVPLEHFFDHYLRQYWLQGPWGAVAADRGHAPLETLDAAPVTLAATLRELDPAGAMSCPENLLFTGPVLESCTPPDATALQPSILVSLSTYNFPGQTESMQIILDAVADLAARVVVTTGPVIDADLLQVPANVEIHRYVDHSQLMPEATLVIGHGGHATTMRALAYDLPLIVLPQHPMLDQTMVGAAVEQAGAGRLLDRETDVESLRAVIEDMLKDGPHRDAAAQLGKLIRESRGASTAADRLVALTD